MDNPIVRRAFEYWSSRTAGRRMPARGDIDPVDIPRLLAHLAILDVVEGGDDFAFRLAGERVAEACGIDLKGRRLASLASERSELSPWFEGARTAVRSGAPHFFELDLNGGSRVLHVGLLPMANGIGVGHLLVAAAISTS